MKTPEEFYADAGFDTHPDAMTETALVTAMMRQYAEYYHKNLVTDEVSSCVRLSLPDDAEIEKSARKFMSSGRTVRGGDAGWIEDAFIAGAKEVRGIIEGK